MSTTGLIQQGRVPLAVRYTRVMSAARPSGEIDTTVAVVVLRGVEVRGVHRAGLECCKEYFLFGLVQP